jgi:hypothetical protein
MALLSAAVVLGISACVPTSDIEVESVSNEKVNMQGYKTYQFLEESGIVEEDGSIKVRKKDRQIAAIIEEVINEELQKRGKTPTAKNPDFLVAYIGGANDEAVKVKLDEKGKQVVEESAQAALLMMLVDAQTGSILRISTAEGEMKNLPMEQTRKRIEFAVKKMLKDI